MHGTVVPSSGIEYHERHTITPDGQISARFGQPLEIPEDLLPIPEERPGTIQSTHPLAKYVHVVCYDSAKEIDVPSGVIVADGVSGTVVRIAALTAKAADEHGALPIAIEKYPAVEITYDEDAIEEENRRRLQVAMRIRSHYDEVIDIHRQRYDARAAAAKAVTSTTPTESTDVGTQE